MKNGVNSARAEIRFAQQKSKHHVDLNNHTADGYNRYPFKVCLLDRWYCLMQAGANCPACNAVERDLFLGPTGEGPAQNGGGPAASAPSR